MKTIIFYTALIFSWIFSACVVAEGDTYVTASSGAASSLSTSDSSSSSASSGSTNQSSSTATSSSSDSSSSAASSSLSDPISSSASASSILNSSSVASVSSAFSSSDFSSSSNGSSSESVTSSSSVASQSSAVSLSSSQNIYIVGNIGDKAFIWKNDTVTILPDFGESAYANDVDVNGSDVYVVGYAYSSSKIYAVCWKNGVISKLPNDNEYSMAVSIVITNNDVHIVGQNKYSGQNRVRYWKNNNSTDWIYDFTVTDLCINNNDVYASMWYTTGVKTMAGYFKNGQPYTPPQSDSFSRYAYSIFVNGADVHLAGNKWTGSKNTYCYWLNNDSEQAIPNISMDLIKRIRIHNQQIIASGYSYNTKKRAALYSNGYTQILTDGTNEADLLDLHVAPDGIVYTCGYENEGTKSIAKYWVNGLVYVIPDTSLYSRAYAIVVK